MTSTASTTAISSNSIGRKRAAELTSGIGALVLGLGLGVAFGERLAGLGVWALVIGALVHGWGMYDKHRIERGSGAENPWWSALLYWLCWVLLAVGALALVARVVGIV
ncbi:MAG: hypothetical protein K0R41_3862 [Geminicoccaceae bacterium]|nr:hypothetical protein [Geminicoccaceae bacterium]